MDPECLGSSCFDAGLNPECLGSQCSDAGWLTACSGNECWRAGAPPQGSPVCATGLVECAPGLERSVRVCAEGLWLPGPQCDALERCDAGACVLPVGQSPSCDESCGHGVASCEGASCRGGAGHCEQGQCVQAGCVVGTARCLDAPPSLTVGVARCGVTTFSLSAHAVGCERVFAPASASAPDQDWRFVAPSSRTYTVTLSPTSAWDPVLSVRAGSCAPTRCLAASNRAGPGQPEVLTFAGVAGVTYILVVDGAAERTPQGSYTLQVQ